MDRRLSALPEHSPPEASPILPFRTPTGPIYRIGRRPDPWLPPSWETAAPDGTFGNRFDDPDSTYRVLYASSKRLGCFLETLARFRPDLTLLAELNQIAGNDDYFPLGYVPRTWLKDRLIGSATASGRYAEIMRSEWIALLRGCLAKECLALGVKDLDAAALQQTAPRRLTQLVSGEVYARDFEGIVYRSKYGAELENWALFEPFLLREHQSAPIREDDPDLLAALKIHRLQMATAKPNPAGDP